MPADDPPAASLPPQGHTVESEHLSELTEEEYEAHYIRRQDLKGFLWLDAKYLNPFFTRRLTQEVGHRPVPCGQGSIAFLLQGSGSGRERSTCYVGEGQPGRLRLARSFPGPRAGCAVDLSVCCFSFAARFRASLIIDLLTQFAFPG